MQLAAAYHAVMANRNVDTPDRLAFAVAYETGFTPDVDPLDLPRIAALGRLLARRLLADQPGIVHGATISPALFEALIGYVAKAAINPDEPVFLELGPLGGPLGSCCISPASGARSRSRGPRRRPHTTTADAARSAGAPDGWRAMCSPPDPDARLPRARPVSRATKHRRRSFSYDVPVTNTITGAFEAQPPPPHVPQRFQPALSAPYLADNQLRASVTSSPPYFA